MNKTIFIFLFVLLTSFVSAQEICTNGIDDDSDGLIDLNDPNCTCNTAAPSLIANPSFETNSGCPSTYQQFNLVSNWVSGNGEAIDYLNNCGFTRFSGVDFPNGNGIAGCYYLEDRLRYIAQCLPSPLTSGTAYKLNFETSALSINNAGNQLDVVVGSLCGFNYNSIPYPVTITLYGTSNCADLPWSGTGSPIGNGSWVVLGQVVYSPTDTLWNDLAINFTPSSNIAAIAIGPPSPQAPQFPIYNQGGNGNIGCFPFIQYDNFILNTAATVVDIEINPAGSYCTNDLELTATSTVSGGGWQWYKNGIALVGQTSSTIQVSTNNFGVGNYTARYTTISSNCYTEDYLVQLASGVNAEFTSSTSCIETIVAFTDLSFAGAYQITNWQWDFGDGNTSTEREPVHRYDTNGSYNAQLIITTSQGCKDTAVHTQTPNYTAPLDVSTCNCGGLDISLIPNYSFEDNSCCPSGFSQLNCADTWVQASDATSDYWNTCGATGSVYNAPLPPPDGNGFAGYIDFGTGYKEYIGACLPQPMEAGKSYTLTFQMASTSSANFAFWAATDCNDLPFSGSGCPEGIGSWQILEQETFPLGGGVWHEVSMTLNITQDIHAVLLGPSCDDNGGGIDYFFVDQLVLSSSILQPVEIEGAYCSNNVVLKSGASSDSIDLMYQWFKGGIELIGETDSVLNVSANGYGIGDYQVMGVYRNGCDVSPIFTVDTAYIDFDAQSTTSCPGLQNGEIMVSNITGLGETAPFLYQINNNTPISDSVFSSLTPGSYVVKVIDSKGCIDSATVVIDSLAAPIGAFSYSDVCEGDSVIFTDASTIANGTITSWQWFFGDGSAPESTTNAQHLYANTGQYTVTLLLQSDSGCTNAVSNSVTVYENPTANAGNDLTICANSSATLNGSIGGSATAATWSGGTGTYVPDNVTLNAEYTPSNVEINAGSATLILTTNDPTGPCGVNTDTVVITINALPEVSAGIDQTICNGNTVTLAGTIGGTATSATWSGGSGAYTPNDTDINAIYTPTVAEANAGTLTLTYTTDDPTGPCTSVNDEVLITINQLPIANAGLAQYVCAGSSITLAGVIGGTAQSATWSGGNGTFNPNNTTLNAVYTPTATEYLDDSVNLTLTTNDPAGPCGSDSSIVTLHFYKNPVVSFFADSIKGCPIHCTDFTNNTTVGGGDNIVLWDWNFGDGSSNLATQTPNHCYENPGFYDVSLTATSNHSCTSSDTISQHIYVFDVPVAGFTASPNPATVISPTVYFSNQSSQDVTQWNWDFGDGSSLLSDTANPEHTYPQNIDATYNVVLVVNNANSCYDTTNLEIIIDPEYTFFIPNAFSPNADGVNDFFNGSGIGISVYDLWVFDRWGNMVFHTSELDEGWDGKSNSGSDASQMDVFIWKVQLTNIFKKKIDLIGTVTLVR